MLDAAHLFASRSLKSSLCVLPIVADNSRRGGAARWSDAPGSLQFILVMIIIIIYLMCALYCTAVWGGKTSFADALKKKPDPPPPSAKADGACIWLRRVVNMIYGVFSDWSSACDGRLSAGCQAYKLTATICGTHRGRQGEQCSATPWYLSTFICIIGS